MASYFWKVFVPSYKGPSNDIIFLNVGGKHFQTRRATLCAVKKSLLERVFGYGSTARPPAEIIKNGNPGLQWFVDRDPVAFGLVLSYLRECLRNGNGTDWTVLDVVTDAVFLRMLRADAEFFGLAHLRGLCDTRLSHIPTVFPVGQQRPGAGRVAFEF